MFFEKLSFGLSCHMRFQQFFDLSNWIIFLHL